MEFIGLTEQEARVRLERDGPNALPDPDRRGAFRILIEVLREPMFFLLMAGGVIYLVVGDTGDALVLLAFAQLSVFIAVVQEYRSERTLAALRTLSTPSTTVVRDGQHKHIPSTELVFGDIVVVSEGERLSADCILRDATHLESDESLLTGESVPVPKCSSTTPLSQPNRPAGAAATDPIGPYLYSGALIVRGQGYAQVIATGVRTEIGKIGAALRDIQVRPTPLTLETRRIVQIVGGAAIVVCTAVVLLFGLFRHAWLDGGLAGIALGMAMLPEEFPLVLTVFMVMGAWRISQAGVLTRRAAAIETLGSASVLCSDKTGTLTQNRMEIVRVWTSSGDHPVIGAPPLAARSVISTGILASARHPFDPMERAFHDAGAGWLPPGSGDLLQVYGLSADLLAVTHLWSQPDDDVRRVAVKGAPEAVIGLCRLDPDRSRPIQAALNLYAEQGLRVLGVAEGFWNEAQGPDSPHDFTLDFLGLVGLKDPLRPGAAASVAECRTAGVRVIMMTGDHPATAVAIAREAGIDAGQCMSGAELTTISDLDLAARIASVNVFARIQPAQKLRIVQALQASGEVVAMTGDGVNDAPALKAADIGIAMGKRGTDVAREASALILMEDDFGSIVRTMRLGRRIYDNLQKAMGFVLSVHVPIAGLALFPLLFGYPIILAPAHIAFLEMVIDPTCSIAFEAEPDEPDLMDRPPRPPAGKLFSRRWVALSLFRGAVALLCVIGLYQFGVHAGMGQEKLRAAVFLALVLCVGAIGQASRSLSGRHRGRTGANVPVLWIGLAVLSAATIVMTVPFLRHVFGFGETGWDVAGPAAASAFVCLVVLTLTGRVMARTRRVAP